jgi:2-dehydro-3-deoxy-D-gluconate 5-dehydrogenase
MTANLMTDKVRYPELLSRIPIGRWAKPEEFAGPAVFLASQASAYITGETILVDGGWMGM